MRKIALFIAMSLDGYIADQNGSVSWLNGHGEEKEADSYGTFIRDVDTVIMGWNTYHQVTTELSPGEWVYSGLTSYVITHGTPAPMEDIIFTSKSPAELAAELKQRPGKKIWVCGGAEVIGQMMAADLIDEYYISVIPVLLGSGIRLFEGEYEEKKLRLVKTLVYNGITDLVYEKREMKTI